MNPMWLVRAKRWSQNPPSAKRIKLVFSIVLACLILVGIEKTIGVPDWMQHDRLSRGGIPR
ncbi:hypothetical protein EDD53_0506 [Pacificibacter maritimus]|uniref:Uncharacterized protein n=1 Tax=Pacificibacter maritimus TaxID=762213 RepID=A0A3N4UMZ0_9RHOB|nr:hypothetical protein [Pacificibacter maritimus]RPE71388.1 hypothetical protein EDD53_0506 [Pacificibacter maritimus]